MTARSFAAAGAGAVIMLIALSSSSGAETGVQEVGWWSRRPGASAQPTGGFEVARGVGAELSVTAIRIGLPPPPRRSVTLRLTESGGVGADTATLQACPTAEEWSAANPGAYDDAPAPDCEQVVELERDADAGTWSGSVGPLLTDAGDVASIMVVPGPAPGGVPLDPGFQLTFSGAEVEIASAGAPPPDPLASPSADPYAGGGAGPPFDGPSTSSSDGFGFQPGPTPSPPGKSGADPAADPGDGEGASGPEPFLPPELASGPLRSGGPGPDRPWGRLALLVPLSALVGVATVKTRRLLEDRGVLEPGG